jgi:hypothetical protein
MEIGNYFIKKEELSHFILHKKGVRYAENKKE